ncbi:MAG: glutamate racemase [Bdellovibrionota bacterium]
MFQESGPIGVFDSGLGGLTVFGELQRAFPDEDFVYLGDMARTPYGSRSAETIVRYSRECSHFLLERGVKIVVVACNTASSLALDALAKDLPCPVVGTIDQAVQTALAQSRRKMIGVIGTEATIGSRAYAARLAAVDPNAEVFSLACPLFVPVVEQGMIRGEIVEKIVAHYLAPLRAQEIDTLILGCTHYPVLAPVIQDYLGESVQIVECSKAMAVAVEKALTPAEVPVEKTGSAQFFVTDAVSRFNTLAPIFLGEGFRGEIVAERVELFEEPHR